MSVNCTVDFKLGVGRYNKFAHTHNLTFRLKYKSLEEKIILNLFRVEESKNTTKSQRILINYGMTNALC